MAISTSQDNMAVQGSFFIDRLSNQSFIVDQGDLLHHINVFDQSNVYDPTSSQIPRTAAQKVLSIGELVGLIFSHLGDNSRTVAICTSVNSLWCAEAIRLRWKCPKKKPFGKSLASIFAGIDPQRRQLYANYVQEGRLDVVLKKNISVWNAFFREVTFHRLCSLTVYVDVCQPRIYLPHIRAPGVTILHIRFKCIHPRLYGMRRIEDLLKNLPRHMVCQFIPMKYTLLTTLKRRFQGLKRVNLEWFKPLDPKVVKDLTEKLSNLEVCVGKSCFRNGN